MIIINVFLHPPPLIPLDGDAAHGDHRFSKKLFQIAAEA